MPVKPKMMVCQIIIDFSKVLFIDFFNKLNESILINLCYDDISAQIFKWKKFPLHIEKKKSTEIHCNHPLHLTHRSKYWTFPTTPSKLRAIVTTEPKKEKNWQLKACQQCKEGM